MLSTYSRLLMATYKFASDILLPDLRRNASANTLLRNDLIDTFLNLEKLDINLYRAHHLLPGVTGSSRVYGGQVIGQAMVASTKTVPNPFHPHSLHAYFMLPANTNIPILYYVDRLRDGKSFSTRAVKAVQEGEIIFSCMLSYHKDEPDAIRHQDVMPEVPSPESLKDAEVLFQEALQSPDTTAEERKRFEARLEETTTFNIRPCDPKVFVSRRATVPRMQVWVKAKGVLPDDDLRLHHSVAAFISDFSLISTAIVPHFAAGFRPSMAASLDHSMWFHTPNLRVDDWLLYDTYSSKARGSRAFSHGRMWTRDGRLVISTAQEGLVRARLDDGGETSGNKK